MARKRIPRKRGFSLKDTPIRKLDSKAKVFRVRSASRLVDQELVFRAFWRRLVEQDLESFKEVLRAHLEAVNKGRLAKRSRTSRRTLYRLLSPQGNPALKSISNVIHALYG